MAAVAPIISPGDLERRTLGKLRWRLVPLLLLLYFVAYLDRTNISFASLTMNAALGISSAQFGLAAGIFFWGYFLFEIPSNLLLHKIGARLWIGRILLTWGVVAMATGAARSLPQLYAARFLLGVAEAGFFPGIILYLTYWFPQREQARIIALFGMALPIASMLGSPVSGFILDHAHWAGIASWRWLLIVEGFPAIICGFLTFFLLPSRPADARFLTTHERAWLDSELACEEREKTAGHRMPALRTLANPRLWQLAAVLFGFDIGLYAMTFYMPQAVKALSSGQSNTALGILVTIPHVAGLATMIIVSRSSDRRMERRFHSAIPLAIGGAALLLLGLTRSPIVSISLWSFVAMGLYGFFGPFFSIPGRSLAGYSAAAGIALINSVGNLGGFVGPSIVGAAATGSRGIYGGLALAGAALFVAASLVLFLPRDAARFVTSAGAE
ncbi:MAG TPA: MFS transporter [Bryobacteraceae bacterium]|nr:MFS transporter [Bryobacteraceae bacterium]